MKMLELNFIFRTNTRYFEVRGISSSSISTILQIIQDKFTDSNMTVSVFILQFPPKVQD